MQLCRSSGRKCATTGESRPPRRGDETLVDVAVPMDMDAGNPTGFPRVRCLVSRPGAEPLDVTAQVLPTVMKIVEIVFLINGDTAELERVALGGATAEFQILPTEFGVRCCYEDGAFNEEVRYLVVKPHVRA
jgi:hypothetical protein